MKIRLLFVLIIALFASCREKSGYTYHKPQELSDGWKTKAAKETGLDESILTDLIKKVQSGEFKNINGCVIVKDGFLVLDEYFNGYEVNTKHKLFSCTKSFSGAIVGMAIDKGYIQSDTERIVKYLGGYNQYSNEHIENITIRDVLTMSSGLKLGSDLSKEGRRMPYSEDMVAFTLKQPGIIKPGTVFQYSSANSMLLAPIVFNATGLQVDEFAEKYLFNELRITNYEWHKQAEFWTKTAGNELPDEKPEIHYDPEYARLTNTASGMQMTPRDMAKLGQLYLDSGQWNGIQLLSKTWVRKSATEQIPGSNYGLHWKLMDIDNHRVIYASGFGMQRIFVFHDLNLVVVFTQNWYHDQETGYHQMMTILNDYLLSPLNPLYKK